MPPFPIPESPTSSTASTSYLRLAIDDDAESDTDYSSHGHDDVFTKEQQSCNLEPLSLSEEVVSPASNEWIPVPSNSHAIIPALQGLRGLAVVMTIICHAIPTGVWQDTVGSMGVSIFFVLSGFLITGVLLRLQETSSSHPARLALFYTDRFVRLAPALITMIVGIWIVHHFGHSPLRWDDYKHYALLALFYVQNFPSLWRGWPGPMNNTWSLANEEQFYVFWSLLLPFVCQASYRVRAAVLSLAIAASLVARQNPDAFGGSLHKLSLAVNVWKMLLGASARLVPLPPCLHRVGAAYTGLALLILANAACFLPSQPFNMDAATWLDPLAAISALLICTGTATGAALPILEGKELAAAGRVSYSWYLWQYPLCSFNGWRRGYLGVTDSSLALVVATISTLYIEEPIRNLYRRRIRDNLFKRGQ